MYRRSDPRWNRTIQHISENLEHANETAAENLYGFTTRYVNPCLASLTTCCNALTAPCLPSTDDLRRRNRARSRGRAELSFDFYDDWEEDESDGLLGWGNDNLERFLGSASNYGTAAQQPGRQRAMSYGTRARDPRFDAARRKSAVQSREGADPTLIPSSSYFGFLGRLPFRLGGQKGLRYKPSAADLTDHPGALRRSVEEGMPLIEDSEEDHAGSDYKTTTTQHRRTRSNTNNSGHTTDSFSSRGDIFPSEDELDDAVPLDDEFTIALERRTTITGTGTGTGLGQQEVAQGAKSAYEGSGRNTRSNNSSKRPSRSASARTASSGKKSVDEAPHIIEEVHVPSLAELEREEERLRRDEEAELERKRASAQTLAVQRGLVPGVQRSDEPTQMKAVDDAVSPLIRSPTSELSNAPEDAVSFPHPGQGAEGQSQEDPPMDAPRPSVQASRCESDEFVPARLPYFQ
jgi:hypothetical protein